ncbi:hypothetical protein CEXT_301561 [Caerostris extrusa]|uniref:Uncharacterized protein n=1 Tax=Caerostris extrusa TaxID=172846 RepID=A0AAV4Q0R3_CAEEX|nr:hypothetical protein CEXT_301561 [Caerostris extrusa]
MALTHSCSADRLVLKMLIDKQDFKYYGKETKWLDQFVLELKSIREKLFIPKKITVEYLPVVIKGNLKILHGSFRRAVKIPTESVHFKNSLAQSRQSELSPFHWLLRQDNRKNA